MTPPSYEVCDRRGRVTRRAGRCASTLLSSGVVSTCHAYACTSLTRAGAVAAGLDFSFNAALASDRPYTKPRAVIAYARVTRMTPDRIESVVSSRRVDMAASAVMKWC